MCVCVCVLFCFALLFKTEEIVTGDAGSKMAPAVTSEVGPGFLDSAKKEFRARNSNYKKVCLESYRGSRSEPAELCRFKGKVIEAKDPWHLGERKGKGICLGRKRGGRERCGPLPEGEQGWVLCLEGFKIWEFRGCLRGGSQ